MALPGAEGGWQGCRLPPPHPADRRMEVSTLEPRAVSSLSPWCPSRATVRTSGFFMSPGDPHTRFSRCDRSVCFLMALMLNPCHWHPTAPGFLSRKQSGPRSHPFLQAWVGGQRPRPVQSKQCEAGTLAAVSVGLHRSRRAAVSGHRSRRLRAQSQLPAVLGLLLPLSTPECPTCSICSKLPANARP